MSQSEIKQQPAEGSPAIVTVGDPSREAPHRAPRKGRPVQFLAVPLLLVNTSAIWGQAGWAHEHIAASWLIAVAFAAAIESVGVYLAWESHEALMADQAAGMLRLGSYGVGGLAGALNYWHFSADGEPTAQAVAFATMSSISPWLWAIWSRARNRTRLAELGMVDVRGVRLSASRKLWHPIRSIRVMSWASWEGITDPADAVRGWELTRHRPEAPVSPATAPKTKEQWWADALQIWAEDPNATKKLVAERLGISARWLRECDPSSPGQQAGRPNAMRGAAT